MTKSKLPHNIRAEAMMVEWVKEKIKNHGVLAAYSRMKGSEWNELRDWITNNPEFMQCLAEKPLKNGTLLRQSWWATRMIHANGKAGIGSKYNGQTGHRGDMTIVFRESIYGTAQLTSKQGKVLHLEFKDVQLGMKVMLAVQQGVGSPGYFQQWSKSKATVIAHEHVSNVLDTYCSYFGIAINLLLPMLDCIGEIKFEELEKLAQEKAKNIRSHKGLDDQDEIPIGSLIFSTLANTKVIFSDIVRALTVRICGVIKRKEGR
jgi:hypothetical protein